MENETKNRYINQIPIENRIKVRSGLAEVKEHIKKQNALLMELYLMPNQILEKKIDLFLKGRIRSEELNQIIEKTRERYDEILNIGKKKK